MKHFSRSYWILIFTFLLSLVHLPSLAFAQAETRLSIQPAVANMPQDGTTSVSIDIANGINLYGFDITVIYDPQIVTLDSWSVGSFFSKLSVVKKLNQPGLLRVVATQLAADPVSGDGTILSLTFRGKTVGSSSVTFQNAIIVDSSSNTVPLVISNGTINVSSSEPQTPTTTVTPTPTATLTVMSTGTASPTRTLIPAGTSVSNRTNTPGLILATKTKPIFTYATASQSTQMEEINQGSVTATESYGKVIDTMVTAQVSSPTPGLQPTPQQERDRDTELANAFLWIMVILLGLLLVSMVIVRVIHKTIK